MAAALFTGAGVALVTLFDDDGRLLSLAGHAIDFPAGLKRQLARTAGTSAAVRAR